jgi:uncharacterized protein YkwD
MKIGRMMRFNPTISLVLCLTLLMAPPLGLAQPGKVDKTEYLSPLEKAVVSEINLVRTSPQKYISFLQQFKKYYDGKVLTPPGETSILTREGTEAVVEAIRFVRSQQSVSSLRPSRGMSLGAKDHVRDQGPSGTSDHQGRDRSQPWERVNRYGTWEKTIGENISLGHDKARNIVMTLLIDDGVPNRGHRRNIFNPNFRVIGVACGEHRTHRTICVITFAGGYQERD